MVPSCVKVASASAPKLRTALSEPNKTLSAKVEFKSSLIVKAVASELRVLPEPPALAVLNIISPPAPDPLPCLIPPQL